MADEGRNADWDEVGRRFSDLGRQLQEAWTESRAERAAATAEQAEPMTHVEGETDEHAGHSVSAAFEELKVSISHTVSHPGVRGAAESATSGFTDALATNLRQLADWIETKP